MVAKTDHKSRALALCASVKDLLENDARDPERVAKTLQSIKDGDARFLVPGAKSGAKRVPFAGRSPHEQWERVYKTVCGKKADCAGIELPPKPDYACWPIIVIPHVPLNAMFAGLKRKFSCWSYYGDDIENAIDWRQEERDGRKQPYGVWVKVVRDAREDMNNISASAVKAKGIKGITLDERIRLEAFYWILTGGGKRGTHLDQVGWNICTGSCGSDGRVPSVGWDDGGVRVRWARRGDAYPDVGVRQVVS